VKVPVIIDAPNSEVVLHQLLITISSPNGKIDIIVFINI